jgi:hypothetical protein
LGFETVCFVADDDIETQVVEFEGGFEDFFVVG